MIAPEENFKPKLGRIRSRGSILKKRYSNLLRVAINRAGGQFPHKARRFTGKRLGRGRGFVNQFHARDASASLRHRHVTVKVSIKRLAGDGFGRAQAHVRYLQREGVTREAERGELYSADLDRADGAGFMDRSNGDRHQFRVIVSPEDGYQYKDLHSVTRRLMEQMEEDLGVELDWVAADHFNTGYPHAHVIVRGKEPDGKDLIIHPEYISHGIRARAGEIMEQDLGLKTDNEVEQELRRDMTEEKFTSMDKTLIKLAREHNGLFAPYSVEPAIHSVAIGRLRFLERYGLAEPLKHGLWRIDDDLESTLKTMHRRNLMVEKMQEIVKERGLSHSAIDYKIHDRIIDDNEDGQLTPKPIKGKLLSMGMLDREQDRHYMIVDGIDGNIHFIDAGRGDLPDDLERDSLIEAKPKSLWPRVVDHNIAAVAEKNDGRYNRTLHREHDPYVSRAYMESHERRLEAIRRTMGGVERDIEGTWTVGSDYIHRAIAYERHLAEISPVDIDKLSGLELDQQITANGATWLDREMVTNGTSNTAQRGFGKEVRDAMEQRQKWLIEEGLAYQGQTHVVYIGDMIKTLETRNLESYGKKLGKELSMPYTEATAGSLVEGKLTGCAELISGKYAIVERSLDFSLVPWRSVLENHIGKEISGVMSFDNISWTIGRQRDLGISM